MSENCSFSREVHGAYELVHPLAKHFLAHLRDKNTKPALFRTLTKKVSLLLGLEASSMLASEQIMIETPLEKTSGYVIQDEVVLIPILRAGLGMLEPIMELFPNVSVGYVGIQRSEETAMPSEYYAKIPSVKDKIVFVADPMLATGGSVCCALDLVKKDKPKRICLLSIVSTPEGIARVKLEHPEVIIFTVSVDRELSNKKYILPGLGDFGDRLYGTEY